MTVVPIAQRMTADKFLGLPERQDSPRLELVEGELIVHEPLPLHQAMSLRLAYALESWIRAAPGRGTVSLPLDVRLDGRNVYAPDLLWYEQGSGPKANQRPSPLPALAVEVRSPSTWRYDVGAKKSRYERRGLPELWLVDTAAIELLVFRRSAPKSPTFDVSLQLTRDDTLTSPLLAGFSLQLRELFPDGH